MKENFNILFNLKDLENRFLEIYFYSNYNIAYIMLFLLLLFLVLTNEKLIFQRKVLFIIINILFIIIVLIINKVPLLIIKDLFWFSLILNLSFIFHILILERIFIWAWENNYEYLAFIISRISFTLSIWGIIYIIRKIFNELIWFFNWIELWSYRYNFEEKNEKYKFRYKYAKFYYNYIDKNIYLKKLFKIICDILWILEYIILIILIYFSKIFNNYILMILGKNMKLDYKDYIRLFIKFIIFLIISIIIGIPRLYIIWIFHWMLELYNLFTFKYYPSLNIREEFEKSKIKEKLYKIRKENWLMMLKNCYYYFKYEELEKIQEKIYHPIFMFDLSKFLCDEYKKGPYRVYDLYLEKDNEDPILNPYKFYTKKELIIKYFNLLRLSIYDDGDKDRYIFEEIIILLKLLELFNYKDKKILIRKLIDITYYRFIYK